MSIGELVTREKKVAYCAVPDSTGNTTTNHRMKGFTSFSINKNPTEYSRRYVDEDFERTDVTGISSSIEFNFDQFDGNPVHDYIANIIDEELIGSDAKIDVIVVDFTKEGTVEKSFVAKKRTYTVIPGSEGDSTDAYTYSGTLRADSETVTGTATSTDEWLTCTFAEKDE